MHACIVSYHSCHVCVSKEERKKERNRQRVRPFKVHNYAQYDAEKMVKSERGKKVLVRRVIMSSVTKGIIIVADMYAHIFIHTNLSSLSSTYIHTYKLLGTSALVMKKYEHI